MYVCVCILYIYIYRGREREREREHQVMQKARIGATDRTYDAVARPAARGRPRLGTRITVQHIFGTGQTGT